MHHNQQTLTKEWKECIAACFHCAQICNGCSDDMIGMEKEGQAELMERGTRLCRECADICVLSGQWMSRVSPVAQKICGFCADICDECAELCEQHKSHHPLCGPCAEECRRCARLCRQMSTATAMAG